MKRFCYISLLNISLLSCDAGSKPDKVLNDAPRKTYLISAKQINDVAFETLRSLAEVTGQDDIASSVKYGVKTYTLVYETVYNNKPIKASGLLHIPQNITKSAPLISLQHGTTFVKNDAPSVSGDISGMEFFAAAGYITIMPDFIGYGESQNIFHPYYDEKHSALTVIDMIKSAKEFLLNENVQFNDQLFLAGYSEGGYVTLATAKAIETEPSHGLQVTAVAAGAGGYDLEGMLRTITTSTHYTYPSYLAFILMAYNITYDWNKPLNYFFREDYAVSLSKYMNGQYDGSYINAKLTTSVTALLNTEFYNRLKTPGGEFQLKQALIENSVEGWKSQIPIRLYHGTEDEIIPYENSEATIKKLRVSGSKDITLTRIPGGSHGSSFVPMLRFFVPWLEEFREKDQ